jgi:hypothetical protein
MQVNIVNYNLDIHQADLEVDLIQDLTLEEDLDQDHAVKVKIEEEAEEDQ